MLVLSRKKNESIVINNDIKIVVVEIRGDKVRLGVGLKPRVRCQFTVAKSTMRSNVRQLKKVLRSSPIHRSNLKKNENRRPLGLAVSSFSLYASPELSAIGASRVEILRSKNLFSSKLETLVSMDGESTTCDPLTNSDSLRKKLTSTSGPSRCSPWLLIPTLRRPLRLAV